MPLSVKCLKQLSLEMNIPQPVVEGSDCSRRINWNRAGGQDYGIAINPHAQSLEELIIAFSDGASFFIRPFYAVHPNSLISETSSRLYLQPLIPPIDSFDDFTELKRLAIPEPLLVRNGIATRSFHRLLPESLEEMHLHFAVGTKTQARDDWGKGLWTARMRALVEDKEAYFPRLKLVICWFQHYALSGLSESDDMTYDNLTYNSKQSWEILEQAFSAVGVQFESGVGAFLEDTPFGQPLNTSHSRLRPPNLVQQGQFAHNPVRPGLYYDSSTRSIF